MTTDTVGGVWTFTKELANELLRRGHCVALVSIGPVPGEGHEEFVRACLRADAGRFCFDVAEAPLEWMPENAGAYSAAENLLLRLCRKFRPDVLLLSQYCFGALPVSHPKILVAHSDVLSWAEAVGKAPLAEDAWLATYRRLVQQGLHGADAVVAPTAAMLTGLEQGFTVKCATSIIPNGRSLPSPDAPAVRTLQAVTAGRLWDDAKNVRMLENVQSHMPVRIAGDSEQATSIDAGGLTFLGRLSERSLLELFRRSAIYICTSLYEPFGLAPLEAALCGCAILCNDIPSLREIWSGDALYFRDACSLSGLLNTLKNQPGQLQAAQQRSTRRAEHYSAARMADGYLHLATCLTTRHGRTAHAA